MFINVTKLQWSYIAGFLDGDGCITVQIVRREDYTLGFQLRFTVQFTQKQNRREHLDWLKNLLDNVGSIRKKGRGLSNVTDYTIVGEDSVKAILLNLQPFLRLKSKQASLCLEIIDKYDTKMSSHDFIQLCKLVDKFEFLNDSKKRTITSKVVEELHNKMGL